MCNSKIVILTARKNMLSEELFAAYNPIDVVEQLFDRRSFELERRGTNEVVI